MKTNQTSHHSENIFDIAIQTKGATGELERILRVIRVRGFAVQRMEGNLNEQGMQMNLILSGSRCIHNLIEQLNKLIDIHQVMQVEVAQPNRMRA